MMPRYIYREQLLELINENCKYKNPTNEYTRGCNEVCDWAIKTIKNIPTADVQEVRHGKWEEIRDTYGNFKGWIHRDCGRYSRIKENYCPNCGTKMDNV